MYNFNKGARIEETQGWSLKGPHGLSITLPYYWWNELEPRGLTALLRVSLMTELRLWFPLHEDRPLGYLLFHFKLRVDSPSFRQDCEIGLCSAASSSLFLILFHEFLVSRDTAYLLLSSSLSPPAFYYQKGNYPFLNLFLCLRIPRNILFTYLVWFCLEWWETVL